MRYYKCVLANPPYFARVIDWIIEECKTVRQPDAMAHNLLRVIKYQWFKQMKSPVLEKCILEVPDWVKDPVVDVVTLPAMDTGIGCPRIEWEDKIMVLLSIPEMIAWSEEGLDDILELINKEFSSPQST